MINVRTLVFLIKQWFNGVYFETKSITVPLTPFIDFKSDTAIHY